MIGRTTPTERLWLKSYWMRKRSGALCSTASFCSKTS